MQAVLRSVRSPRSLPDAYSPLLTDNRICFQGIGDPLGITNVRVTRVSGKWTEPEFDSGSRQAKPLDIYPELNEAGEGSGRRRDRVSALYLEITADDSVTGCSGQSRRRKRL